MTSGTGPTRREALVLAAATAASIAAGTAAVLWRRSSPETVTAAPSTSTGATAIPPSTTTTTDQPTSTTSSVAEVQVVEVLCRDAWGAAPAGVGTTHVIDRITVHHSATRLDDNREVVDHVRGYQRTHQTRGWIDLAYHFVIDAEGNVFEARAADVVGDTSTSYDPTGHFLAMCDGNFEEQEVPDAQFDGLASLLAWAVGEYGLTVDDISAHRDHASTACPGQHLYDRMTSGELAQAVQARLDVGPVERRIVCGPEAEQRITAIREGV